MKSVLILLQFCGIIACIRADLNFGCDKKIHFVWTNEVGLEDAVKTCEFHNGTMGNWEFQFIMRRVNNFTGRDEIKAMWIYNTMNTIIPKKLNENFENLIDLRVENTDLSQIDAVVTVGLSKIRRLYLGKNEISKISHDAFNEMTHLQIISLNNNRISHIKDSTFKLQVHLQKISLSFNKLSQISNKLFSGNEKLQEIYLQGNNLNTIESDAFEKTALKVIDLRDNDCVNLSTFPDGNDIYDVLDKVQEQCQTTN
jgi:Leucine-rich repeat (LRR) protein